MSYRVFHRAWWKKNKGWPGGREPGAGHKTTLAERVETETEARAICKRYNDTHKPGLLSRKAEYEEN